MSAASTVLSLLRHASPTLPRCRSFHCSSARLGALVGPSDPVSHMRPILYDDPPLPRRRETTHPYSLREFNGDARDDQDFDLLWRMQRQELDRFNHNFWADSNTRFEAARAEVLASLPPSASPIDKERAESTFYTHWLMQEAERQRAYSAEWRRRNLECILMAARVQWRKMWGGMKFGRRR
ncbi:hypothetical protein PLICRDRAFT_111186 [Plicaturopsis crispa FD-325 SS-3]|nr:hypothetical protein PLICRDRAFT_111186 [Plicaturopsis crispa FD-325 SS-3]